ATLISLLLSLTLSPALAALLLKPHADDRPHGRFVALGRLAGEVFNRRFERLGLGYAALTRRLVARPRRMMTIYAGLIAATLGLFFITPTGFIPAQDAGYFLTAIQLPPGSSIERTDATMRKVAARI